VSAGGRPFVRREVGSLPHGDHAVGWYARAVGVMQAREPTDPTSWTYQAAIHGTHARRQHRLFNQCRHGTWYFVAWHRMFVFYFERIARAAVVAEGGPADWALPYWNYGLGGRHGALPRAFRHPTRLNRPNPLFVAERDPRMNAGAAVPPEAASPSIALSRRSFTGTAQFGGGVTPAAGQFFSQTGQLEQTPHNDVHGIVGGTGGWMNDPDQAAADPIFWLHHANIDRLWAVWNGAGHANPTDARWADEAFTFFDADGTETTKRCREVVDTIGDLGYTYDPAPATSQRVQAISSTPGEGVSDTPGPEPQMVGATEAPVRLDGGTTRVTVHVDARAHAEAIAAAPEPRILLNVEDIEADTAPGTVYGIYVDLPPDAPPDQAALHHAGNLSFFGAERARHPRGDEHAHSLRVSVDITDLARTLQRAGQWDPDRIEVTFRPLAPIAPEPDEAVAALPPSPADPPVTLGRVSVYYE
jgi:Common central domain of tyrosinase/Polyphenol oxidase middle domain